MSSFWGKFLLQQKGHHANGCDHGSSVSSLLNWLMFGLLKSLGTKYWGYGRGQMMGSPRRFVKHPNEHFYIWVIFQMSVIAFR